jgi:hypothetical protein
VANRSSIRHQQTGGHWFTVQCRQWIRVSVPIRSCFGRRVSKWNWSEIKRIYINENRGAILPFRSWVLE